MNVSVLPEHPLWISDTPSEYLRSCGTSVTSHVTVSEIMEHHCECFRPFGITLVNIFTYKTLLVIIFGTMSTPYNCLWNHGITLQNIYGYMEHPTWICMELWKTSCERLSMFFTRVKSRENPDFWNLWKRKKNELFQNCSRFCLKFRAGFRKVGIPKKQTILLKKRSFQKTEYIDVSWDFETYSMNVSVSVGTIPLVNLYELMGHRR